MKRSLKKSAKKFLKLFLNVHAIPFTDNGQPAEYCTMYLLRFKLFSTVLPA